MRATVARASMKTKNRAEGPIAKGITAKAVFRWKIAGNEQTEGSEELQRRLPSAWWGTVDGLESLVNGPEGAAGAEECRRAKKCMIRSWKKTHRLLKVSCPGLLSTKIVDRIRIRNAKGVGKTEGNYGAGVEVDPALDGSSAFFWRSNTSVAW